MNEEIKEVVETANTLKIQYHFDVDWLLFPIKSVIFKSRFVFFFETNDPDRIWQALTFLKELSKKSIFSIVYKIDLWQGLSVVNGNAEKKQSSSGKPISLEQLLRNFEESLENSRENSGRKILMLTNLDLNNRFTGNVSSVLNLAIRSYLNEDYLKNKNAALFIFSPDSASVLESELIQLIDVVTVPISTAEDRKLYYKRACISSSLGSQINSSEPTPAVIEATRGLNLEQLDAVFTQAIQEGRSEDVSFYEEIKSKLIKKSKLLNVEKSIFTFDDIGGYEKIKKYFKDELVELYSEIKDIQFAQMIENSHQLRKRPGGILLFGPPGTGKTLFAMALANEVKMPFVRFLLENVFSPWLGESGRTLRDMIRLAEEMSPCVIFIDEIDRLGQRGASQADTGGETRRVFGQLLEWLGSKGRETIVVAATNTPHHLDDALIRAGRFDIKIPILYPDWEARKKILEIYLKKSVKEENLLPENYYNRLDELKNITQYKTCAELELAVIRACNRSYLDAVRAFQSRNQNENLSPKPKTFEYLKGELERYKTPPDRKVRMAQELTLSEFYCDDTEFVDEYITSWFEEDKELKSSYEEVKKNIKSLEDLKTVFDSYA